MKYLMDTHTLIWYFKQKDRFSDEVKFEILNPGNAIYISIASLWEIAIKISINKIELDLEELITKSENTGFVFLPVKKEYIQKIVGMPFIHRDPFDRIIIATSVIEKIPIITADQHIQKYDISWIW
ncbi:MAG: type II toxin-antitoxin system VapC family toxin [Oscillospiraceae bacterium]|nr:type II toxin-antitoxin system VapC family toxin [Oscillospiraceae bacterium]